MPRTADAAARFIVFDLVSRVATGLLPDLSDSGALAVSLVAGALSGMAASIITQPLDTAVVRLCESGEDEQSTPSDEATANTGMIDSAAGTELDGKAEEGAQIMADLDDYAGASNQLCVIDEDGNSRGMRAVIQLMVLIAQEDGLGALFAGGTTRALYIALLSAIQFFIYEGLKIALQVHMSRTRGSRPSSL